jgi:group I intron endonuclease
MIVYLITNLVNGKRYIGQTSRSLEWRWHIHQTRKGCRALRNAIDKYGANNFSMEVLFDVPTKELAGEFETEYISRYNTKAPNGYNLTDGGEGVVGLSLETRKRRAQKLLGNKCAVGAIRTPEYLKAMSERYKGRVFSDETRRKMSEAAQARVVSQETKDKHREVTKRLGLRPPIRTSEEAAIAGHISGHKRYHVARGIIKLDCDLCQGIQCQSTIASEPQTT